MMKLLCKSALFLSACLLSTSSVLAATPQEIEQQIATLDSVPLYIETPLLERFQVTSDDIVRTMSVDGTKEVSYLRVDTAKLLENLAAREGKTLIPEATTLRIQETGTGIVLPTTDEGMGYAVQHSLFEKLLTERILAAKRKPTVIQTPSISINPTIVLEKADGSKSDLAIVAHGISDFRGSSKARVHNIRTGMAHFQGHRIDPGATFSFNTLLGEVDGSTGYMKELVIKGDRTIPDYGGGVCQVSTTMYRAALRAGFPIVERKPHSYAVSYYTPWGSDATIYPGVIDLQFQNDMSTPVYIHYFIEGTNLHTMLYGTPDGRTVELSGPNVYGHMGAPNPKVEYVTTLAPGRRVWKEYGHNGFSAWWERRITSSTGAVLTEKINSIYEPRGGWVIEGKAAAEVPLQAE